jgi:hypothetical protein
MKTPLDVLIDVYSKKLKSNKNSLAASVFIEAIELANNLRPMETELVNAAYTEGFKDALNEAKKELEKQNENEAPTTSPG